jgi:hypothetical protein
MTNTRHIVYNIWQLERNKATTDLATRVVCHVVDNGDLVCCVGRILNQGERYYVDNDYGVINILLISNHTRI